MGGGMSIEMWLAEDDNAVFRSELQHKVFEEFSWEQTLDAADIGVTVEDSVVTLCGSVKSYMEKLAAERAAMRVRGVQAVRNDVAVMIPAFHQKSDREIARAASDVIEADALVPHDAVRARVAGGWVQLSGEVSRHSERLAAVAAVQRLAGVRGVANAITLKAAPPPADLRARITAALERCPTLRRDHIEVEAEGGAALLHGRVRSLAEREEAEQAIWAVPGMTSVRNELEVDR
jgi:osmotically-inducible protein OsmY